MLAAEDFEGTWVLQREIIDLHSKQNGEFRGTAELRSISEKILRYAETGEVQLGDGPVMTATRAYGWQFSEDLVNVTFTDGAPFHSFTPSGAAVGTDHLCGDDFYQVTYDFTQWPDWTAAWSVSGPRKDYTSISRYARVR